ncbi:TRAP-type C4-dicarboxylate transport system, small permease component [Meinhardsimonia xiamenensis]|jgi:TRAP-type C4-dicarboxylate transport system permease small subunit|uniref:TRAP transporter small permease protein n=1 Tax=Meinhardsimonia xiamenensis TaxID=990712 RepID=A0A1G9GEA8_9RHOB|nr:TRAP transporter small permease [Meinhardsimonia xiamenensis]PRX31936.1 TRAP-type C4-dicarboxylate transport system permease small subunit [Meinhardsimonia xiamenensis]SDK98942.1 TRAP-type C4-dicarboxylate transport system, small permease component [Meinhardsimonia xiamenensis]
MSAASTEKGRPGIVGAAARLIDLWAIGGGMLLIAVVVMNVLSVIGGVVWVPFPGDFELTEVGVAVAAFAFLPYCQLHRANVTADIFTANASPRLVSFFSLLGSVVALLFSLLLLWRMYAGMLDQKEYDYTTAIVQLPIWWAFVPILISLALLAVASLITLSEDIRGAFGRRLSGGSA